MHKHYGHEIRSFFAEWCGSFFISSTKASGAVPLSYRMHSVSQAQRVIGLQPTARRANAPLAQKKEYTPPGVTQSRVRFPDITAVPSLLRGVCPAVLSPSRMTAGRQKSPHLPAQPRTYVHKCMSRRLFTRSPRQHSSTAAFRKTAKCAAPVCSGKRVRWFLVTPTFCGGS